MKKALNKTALLLLLVAFSLSTKATTLSQEHQKLLLNKRETMKSVLQALEEGREYDPMPYWRENEYGFSYHFFEIPDYDFNFDFDWDFPELRFNDEFLDDMEKRLEGIEERMHERLRELEERVDSLNDRLSIKYRELI